MNLHEVLAPPNIPVYRKTVDQETEERSKLNFMNELTAKMANDLDSQIKAGNVTLPIVSTAQPQQPQVQPQVQSAPQAPAQAQAQLPPHVKAAQQTLGNTGGQFSKLPSVAAQAEKIRKEKQAKVMQNFRTTESVTFEKLNSLFENIININEADQPISITEYIVGLFVNTMKSPIFKNDPELSAKLQELAHKVETTYNLDKGKAAINELVDFGYNSLRALRKPNVRQQSSSTTSTPANTTAAPTAPTSNFGINPDGSITISGAKGQAPSKILPGDPLYAKFVAYINKELSK